MTKKSHEATPRDGGPIGESKRDYPHSSGDRNTKKSESDWPEFEGGEQRDAAPGGAAGEG